MSTTPKPAELLTGMTLDDGWEVTQLLSAAPGGTGGNFSVSYLVDRDSATAFLKALDLTFVMTTGTGSLVDRLGQATAAYQHDRDIVLSCTGARMSNVVRALAAGEATVDRRTLDSSYHLFADVPYLVFEQAIGDVRAAIDKKLVRFDDAWCLRMLHGAANGIRQIHQAEMAHQDMKPSNVMAFEHVGKVGDLGRASPPGGNGLFDGHFFAGDNTYAPPELLYKELQPDDRVRRRSADLYQVGSLIAFFFTRSGMTAMLEAELDAAFHWRGWPNDYSTRSPTFAKHSIKPCCASGLSYPTYCVQIWSSVFGRCATRIRSFGAIQEWCEKVRSDTHWSPTSRGSIVWLELLSSP